jgi:hypothetical protein
MWSINNYSGLVNRSASILWGFSKLIVLDAYIIGNHSMCSWEVKATHPLCQPVHASHIHVPALQRVAPTYLPSPFQDNNTIWQSHQNSTKVRSSLQGKRSALTTTLQENCLSPHITRPWTDKGRVGQGWWPLCALPPLLLSFPIPGSYSHQLPLGPDSGVRILAQRQEVKAGEASILISESTQVLKKQTLISLQGLWQHCLSARWVARGRRKDQYLVYRWNPQNGEGENSKARLGMWFRSGVLA